MIRVLMISMDRNIFDRNSQVAQRMVDYGKIFDELHIIVFALDGLGLNAMKLSMNVWIYPTNSKHKLSYIKDAVKIGKKELSKIFFGETVISSSDASETGLVGWLLKKATKFPLQVQIHTDIFSPKFYNHNLLNLLRFFMASFILRRADTIRVVSKSVAQIIKDPKKKITAPVVVLPIFVDINRIKEDPITVNLRLKYAQWEHIILMAARLESEKRVDIGLRAFSEVLKKFPKTLLLVIGRGSEEGNLRRLAYKLGIEKNVIFEPWQQNLSSYLKTSTVFLSTSSYEGYGMTLVEAGAAGCPIVTSGVGVSVEFLEDGRNAFICKVGDKKCFTNKLITLFENPILLRQFSNEISKDIVGITYTKEQYLENYKKSLELALGK